MTKEERLEYNRRYKKEYSKTKDGVVTQIYSSERASSKRRGHNSPTYSKQELKDWLFSQKEFHEHYDNWKNAGYPPRGRMRPSVDRLDDSKGYSMDNIQLTTWGVNNAKGNKDRRLGKLRTAKKRTQVRQYLNDGNYNDYISIGEAARATGIPKGNICSACKGTRKTAGGFKWTYIR